MGLVGFEVDQAWGSHQPVLKALVEVVQPQSVVECGSGMFSTPLLREHVPTLVTVEHDQQWARRMLKECPSSPSHRWIVQGFPGAQNHTPAEDLPADVRKFMEQWYWEAAAGLEPFHVLFVDTFRSLRVTATKALAHLAQIVVLHDVEPFSRDYYRWNLLDGFWNGWVKTFHAPPWKIQGKWDVPWTGILSRTRLPVEKMDPVIARESIRLWGGESYLTEGEF